MSNDSDWKLISRAEESVPFAFATVCVAATKTTESAIDHYYGHVKSLVVRSLLPVIQADDVLTRLLVLELTSAAETYFRSVLVGMLDICPSCRSHAGGKQLTFRSIDYYSSFQLPHALLEGVSLSGSNEVSKQTNALLGFAVDQNSSVGVALTGFAKVCQLRHAVVHARGLLTAQNLFELGVDAMSARCVSVNAISFQSLVSLCHSAVRAYNRFIYEKTVDRWIAEPKLTGIWRQDKRIFAPLYGLLYSTVDSVGPRTPVAAYKALKSKIDARLR